MTTAYTPEQDALMLRLAQEGLSRRQIGERLGITRSAVIGRLARIKGVKFPSQIARAETEAKWWGAKRKARFNKENKIIRECQQLKMPRNEKIRRLRDSGLPLTRIGKEFGISRERVRQILLRTVDKRAQISAACLNAEINSTA